MITQQTAEKIWWCYREIKVAERMLEDMQKENEAADDDERAPTLRDAFGHKRHLQLGIPSGPDNHRLLDVAPELAKSVIRAHIAQQNSQLVEANEQARLELGVVKGTTADERG